VAGDVAVENILLHVLAQEIRCRFTILARARKGGKSGPDYAPKDELTPDYAHVPPREVGGTRVYPNPRMKRPCISLAVA